MPYYYSAVSQQNTNGSANTDTLLLNLKTTAAGARAYIQKLQAGSYATPADNAVRLRLQHSTANVTAGTGLTPPPNVADAPASATTVTTLPTAGTLATVFNAQLAFNERGTGLWAAFTVDEAIGIVGTTAANQELILNSQSTGATVPVNFAVYFSE